MRNLDDVKVGRSVKEELTGEGIALSHPHVRPDGSVDWESALKANENWMRSVISQRVGEQSAVDEVFQNVALAAARQKAPLRDPSKVGAWLYRLVVVQSALYRRSLGRKRKLLKRCEDRANPSENDARQSEPVDWLLRKERKQWVQKALTRLPDDERQLLLMKYAEDKSYQEISDELGSTVSAVQSKLHRARARMKKTLQTFVVDN